MPTYTHIGEQIKYGTTICVKQRRIFIPYIYIHKHFKYLQMISMIQIDIDTPVYGCTCACARTHAHTHTSYIKLEATFVFREKN